MKRIHIEEIFNAITHGIGFFLAIAGLVLLLLKDGQDTTSLVAASIFGTTLILLYLISTLYHSLVFTRLKDLFQLFDHLAIYLIIAGTYTYIALGLIKGTWGWILFGLIWGLASIGITFKTVFKNKHHWVSLVLYLLMGWLVVIAIEPTTNALSATSFQFLWIGGLCYTIGIIFYLWESLPFSHSTWHLFVLGGSISHFFTAYLQ